MSWMRRNSDGFRPAIERPVLVAAFPADDGGQGASLAGAYLARAWSAIGSRGSTRRASTTSRRRARWCRSSTGDCAGSSGRRTPSFTPRFQAAAATPSSCSASSRTSLAHVLDLVSHSRASSGRARAHSRLAARRRAAHAAGARHRQCDRSELIDQPRPAGVALRGAHGHRRRAARRVRPGGPPSASLWAAVPHYVSLTPSPRAAKALVDRLADLLGADVDTRSSTRPPTPTRSR